MSAPDAVYTARLVAHELAVIEFEHTAAHRVDDALVVGGHDTVVPVRLMRSSNRMIPTVVAGSRFPDGSSARRINGRLTNARAIDTRCCSPPGSSVGKLSAFLLRPTRSRIWGTCVRTMCLGRPMTSSANATFS